MVIRGAMKNFLIAAAAVLAVVAVSAAVALAEGTAPQIADAATQVVHSPGLFDVGQAFSQAESAVINSVLQGIVFLVVPWVAYEMKKKWNIEASAHEQQSAESWLLNEAASLAADGSVRVTVVNGVPHLEVNPASMAAHAAHAADQLPSIIKSIDPADLDAVAAQIRDRLPKVPGVASMMAAAVHVAAVPPAGQAPVAPVPPKAALPAQPQAKP
jgi:hypothetical protein